MRFMPSMHRKSSLACQLKRGELPSRRFAHQEKLGLDVLILPTDGCSLSIIVPTYMGTYIFFGGGCLGTFPIVLCLRLRKLTKTTGPEGFPPKSLTAQA